MKYLKEDYETGVNSLYVLSQSEDNLESLMLRLSIAKEDLVNMMILLLEENINEVH